MKWIDPNSLWKELPSSLEALAPMKAQCKVADLTIVGYPVVLNPFVIDKRSVCLGAENPWCVTGGDEVHMNKANYMRMSIPNEFAGVEGMVRQVQRQLEIMRANKNKK